jgi:hypothetical protein
MRGGMIKVELYFAAILMLRELVQPILCCLRYDFFFEDRVNADRLDAGFCVGWGGFVGGGGDGAG